MNGIMIIGVGGAGCNMAETFKREAKTGAIQQAQYVFADTKLLDEHQKEDGRIFLDLSHGIPTNFFDGIKKVYILAGMGFKTGTTYAPILAMDAKKSGVDYVSAIVTSPFLFEGERHVAYALDGLAKIKSLNLNLVIALDNERLHEQFANINVFNAFDYADKAVLSAIEDTIKDFSR